MGDQGVSVPVGDGSHLFQNEPKPEIDRKKIDAPLGIQEEDGSTTTIELNDLAPEWYELFVPMGEHVSSLFTTDDLAIAASKLPNNSAAMLILWENLWVANLRKALVDAGGRLVERAQIAPEVVEQFVQALAAE